MNCDICDRPFKNDNTLNRHKRSAHDVFKRAKKEKYTCYDCKKKFPRKTNLRKHIRSKHLNKKISHISCPSCSLSVRTHEDLRFHISTDCPEFKIIKENHTFKDETGKFLCGI